MLILGIILLAVGWVIGLHLLFIAGVVVALIGLILLAVGASGRSVGSRRYWY